MLQRITQVLHIRYSTIVMVLALAVAAVIFRRVELNTPDVPVGDVPEAVVDWSVVNLSPVLDTIRRAISQLYNAVETYVFLWIPWPVWVVAIGLLAFRVISPGIGLLLAGGLLLVQLMGVWENAMITIALVSTSMILTVIIAIPLGIAASRSNRLETIMRPALDAMQTVPSFVYLLPAVMLFSVGKVPAILATLVFSIPPTIRLTNLGLRQVSPEAKEAALAFGATAMQLLVKVEIPLALRTIMAGVNQSTMMAVGMVIIAAFIGAGGLGYDVLFATNRVRVGMGFEAGLAVLMVAIVLDRLTQALGKIGQPVKRKGLDD